MASVYISYGWAEGPLLNRRFRQYLAKHDLQITSDSAQADIVFAHSGGVFTIKHPLRAKTIVLVGIPVWPHKSLVVSLAQKIWQDFHTHRLDRELGWWIYKSLCNFYYGLFHLNKTPTMWRGRRQLRIPVATAGGVAIIVRNRHDSFCTPNIKQVLASRGQWEHKSLHAGHDDCWAHPEEYIKLMLKDAKAN